MKRYNLVIGPFECDDDGWTNGLSENDRKELLEDEGWVNVRVDWLPAALEEGRSCQEPCDQTNSKPDPTDPARQELLRPFTRLTDITSTV